MSPIRMSRVESAVRLVLEFHEACNRQDIPGMVNLLSEDCTFEGASPAPDGQVHSGREAVASSLEETFRRCPHQHIEIEDIFSLGLRCVMRWKGKWTDQDGKQRHIRGVDLYQVRDGLICEKLSYVKG